MVNTIYTNPYMNEEQGANAPSVLFVQNEVVIYFESQEQAEAAIAEALTNGMTIVRLYVKEA